MITRGLWENRAVPAAHGEWTIEWYRKPGSEAPLKRFLEGLAGRNKDEAIALIELLQKWGSDRELGERRRPKNGCVRVGVRVRSKEGVAAMAKKTQLRKWIDQQYAKDPGLRRRVNELMNQMELEQGLVTLREQRGISQSQLAKILGVSQPAIAKLETGRAKNVKLQTVARYVAALGGRMNIDVRPQKRRAAKA